MHTINLSWSFNIILNVRYRSGVIKPMGYLQQYRIDVYDKPYSQKL